MNPAERVSDQDCERRDERERTGKEDPISPVEFKSQLGEAALHLRAR